MNLLKLYRLPKGTTLTEVVEHPHSVEYCVSYDHSRICPDCSGSNCVVKGHKLTHANHLPLNETGTFLTFTRNRYLCKDCNSTFFDRPDWLHPDLNITMPLYHKAVFQLTDKKSQISVAADCNISPKMVSKVIADIVLDHPRTLPEALGMDEFTGDIGEWNAEQKRWKKKTQYLTTICDLTNIHNGVIDKDGRNSWIIDVLEERSIDFLKKHFTTYYSLEQRKAVKYFCCDMHGGFISLAKQIFPCAHICFDMFHIVQRLNRAINLTRLRIQRSYVVYTDGRRSFVPGKEDDYDFLQKSSRTLIMNEVERPVATERRKARLQRCFALSSDLEEVYNAVQEFHALKVDPGSIDIRPALLSDWIESHKNSDVPELRDVVNSIQNWRPYIQNTWKYFCSNASCEGLNREIKDVKRLACGYHTFAPFRKRILLSCGPMKHSYKPYSIRRERGKSVPNATSKSHKGADSFEAERE